MKLLRFEVVEAAYPIMLCRTWMEKIKQAQGYVQRIDNRQKRRKRKLQKSQPNMVYQNTFVYLDIEFKTHLRGQI